MTDKTKIFDALKQFLGFSSEDATNLKAVAPWVAEHGPQITDAFYETIANTPDIAKFIEGRLEHLKKTHIKWMTELVSGPWDMNYFESRWKIGETHVKIGLDPYWVEATMSLIRTKTLVRMASTHEDKELLTKSQESMIRACDMDLAIINLAYGEDRLERLSDFTGMKRALIENIIKLPKK